MKKLIQSFLVALFFINSASANQSTTIDVDGKNIVFPQLSSFVEAPQELVDLLSQMQPNGTKVAFAYLTPEDFDRFENYEEPTFPKFVQISIYLNDGEDIPFSQFQREVLESKQELVEIEQSLSKVNLALVERDKYISNLSDIDLSNVIEAIIPMPTLLDNENIYAGTILAARKQMINGSVTRTARILTTVGIYINNRILNVAFYSNMEKEDDIKKQEEMVKSWLIDFYSSNLSSSQSQVNNVSSYQAPTDCNEYSKMAKMIMSSRQNGKTMSEVFESNTQSDNKDTVRILNAITRDAYSSDWTKWGSKGNQENEIIEFANEIFSSCIDQ
jgi:hypothetical protein